MMDSGLIGGGGRTAELTTCYYLKDALDQVHIVTSRGAACGLEPGAGWQPLDVANDTDFCPRCLAADRAYRALKMAAVA